MKQTTYAIATNWLGNSYILCNNISNVDPTIWDNCRFDLENEDGELIEIYQFYLTDASESDVEWLESNFKLKFTYSDKLDFFILCVDHIGTGWDYVACDCSDDLIESNPKIEYTDPCYPPKFEISRKIISGGK